MRHRTLALVLVTILIAGITGRSADWAATIPDSVAPAKNISGDAKAIRSLGVKYIVRHQNPDGSYGAAAETAPGTTGFVVYVLATCQRGYQVVDGPYMSEAVDYLLNARNDDGSFGASETLATRRFNTGLAVMALNSLKSRERYSKIVADGLKWLADHAGTRPADEIWGGLLGLWPTESCPLLAALQKTRQHILLGGSRRAVAVTVTWLTAGQNRVDDDKPEYGGFAGTENTLSADPVVATALAVKTADLIKDNYKKLPKTNGAK